MLYRFRLLLLSIIVLWLNITGLVTDKLIILFGYPVFLIGHILGVSLVDINLIGTPTPKPLPDGTVQVLPHVIKGPPIASEAFIEIPFIILMWFLIGYVIDKFIVRNRNSNFAASSVSNLTTKSHVYKK